MNPPKEVSLEKNSHFFCFQGAKLPSRREVLITGVILVALAMVAVAFYTVLNPSSSVATFLGGKVGTYVLSSVASVTFLTLLFVYYRSLHKGSKKQLPSIEKPPLTSNGSTEKPVSIEEDTDLVGNRGSFIVKEEKENKDQDKPELYESNSSNGSDKSFLYSSVEIHGEEEQEKTEEKYNSVEYKGSDGEEEKYASIEIKNPEEEQEKYSSVEIKNPEEEQEKYSSVEIKKTKDSPSLNESTNHKPDKTKEGKRRPFGIKFKKERLRLRKRVSLERSSSFKGKLSLVLESAKDEKENSESTKNKKKINETILDLPWDQELEEEIKNRDGDEDFNVANFSKNMSKVLEEKQKVFIENALDVLKDKKMPPSSSLEKLKLSTKQLKQLEDEVIPHIHKKNLPQGSKITLHDAGEHIVFEHEDLKGLIFKVESEGKEYQNEEKVKKYVKLREDARKFCEENQLYLIQIPACKYIKVADHFVVVEEKIEDLLGETDFQRGFYRWGLDQTELSEYFYELFRQMTLFICKMKFSDVKYNNIPLSIINGRVVFIDLDNEGAIYGLVRGLAGQAKGNGLLNYIPKKWLSEFITLAKDNLSKKESDELDRWLEGFEENGKSIKSISTRVLNTKKKRDDHAKYLKEIEITSPSSPIKYDKEAIQQVIESVIEEVVEEEKKRFEKEENLESETKPIINVNEEAILATAERFVKEINKTLVMTANFDLMHGRKIELDLQSSGNSWKYLKNKKIFSQFNRKYVIKENGKPDFKSCIRPTLKALEKAKLIHRFKYEDNKKDAFKYARNAISATIWA